MIRKLGSFAFTAATAAALLVTAVALAHSGQQPRRESNDRHPAPSFQQPVTSSQVTYQGRLYDASASPLTGTVTLTVRLYDAPALGALVWEETHAGVRLAGGVFTIVLGESTLLLAEHVDGLRWLELSVNGGAPLLPRQPLGAAPRALSAGQAFSATCALSADRVPWAGIMDVPSDLADGDDVGAPLTHTHAGGDIAGAVGYATTATLALSTTRAAWSSLAGVPLDLLDGDDDALRALACADGQLAKWSGSTWVCGDDRGSTYTAGFGLVLAGEQFAVTTATVQQRVGGHCAVGATIRAVHADGSVSCQPDSPLRRALPPATTVSTTLAAGEPNGVGWYSSVTVGADGLPVISFQDNDALSLEVAHCDDVACTSATITTVDSTCGSARWTSIAIGADGLPVISYYADNVGSLRIAHCSDLACTAAAIADVDGMPFSGNVAGYYSSIAIGADGKPVVSHYDTSGTALRVSHCNDVTCSSASNATVDDSGGSGGDTGWWSSIAVGADGKPVISYYDNTTTGQDLKVAHCNDLACTSAISTVLDAAGDVGRYTSLAIGADSFPIVSYMDFGNRDLKVAHCADVACTAATTATLASDGDVGRYGSITIGPDNLPLISYYDYTAKALGLARCTSYACAAATVITLDASSSDVGAYPALTIGADALPLIAYYDAAGAGLKTLHCANALCTPYFRRR